MDQAVQRKGGGPQESVISAKHYNSSPSLAAAVSRADSAAHKVMKKLRKSIHISHTSHSTGEAVLNKPTLEEELIPIDILDEEERGRGFMDHIRKALEKGTVWYMRSPTVRLVVIFAAILSCCTYVFDTYATNDMRLYHVFAYVVDIGVFIIFLADYVSNILFNASAAAKTAYIFSFQGFVDFASLFSIMNIFVNTDLRFFSLFRLMRVLKVMRVFRMTSIMINTDDQVVPNASEAIYFDIVSLVLGILLAWFLFSSLLYTMVQQDANAIVHSFADENYNIQDDLTFFDCVYIMMVIVSTLGFGDYAPGDRWGRLFVILVLLSALTIVPMKVGKLIDTIGKTPEYITNKYQVTHDHRGHIVLSANLGAGDFQKLINLILSEGGNDPEIIEHAVPIALLSNTYPSIQLALLLRHPMNARKVQFFVGDIKNQSDLNRVKAHRAKAILIFTDSFDRCAGDTIDNVVQDDYSLKLKVVSLLSYLDAEAKKRMLEVQLFSKEPRTNEDRPTVICQTTSHEVCFSLLNKGVDRIISKNNIKYSMLAYGSMFPGFLSLVYTLTMPSYIYNKKKHVRNSQYWDEGLAYEWGHGFELREVTATQISDSVKNLTFSQLCRVLYSWSEGNAICVGVYNFIKGERGGVLINPERTVRIADCSSIFIICNDYPVVLAMLRTTYLSVILKKLYDDRPRTLMYDGSEARARAYTARPSSIELDSASQSDAVQLGQQSNRLTALWDKSLWRFHSDSDIGGNYMTPEEASQLEFKRGPNCFCSEANKTVGSSKEGAISEDMPVENVDLISSPLLADIVKAANNMSRCHSTDSLKSAVSLAYPAPRYPMGRGLSFLPEASVVYGEDDGDGVDTSHFLVPKQFSDHVVLICAFQPTYALIRIVAAVETFVSSMRSRSDEIIVVMSTRAIEIEKSLRKKCRSVGEFFDSKLCFIYGLPNSIRHLRNVDACFARSVVIVGNEFVDDADVKLDHVSAVEVSSISINSDLYILLAALEVESLLVLHKRHLAENGRNARIPIVIQEIFNDSNNLLLPDSCKDFNVAATAEKHSKPLDMSSRQISGSSGSRKSFFSPALLQGRIFSAKMFDALTVQMLFNPNLLEFWQVLMGKTRMSNLRSKRNVQGPTKIEQGLFDVLSIPEGFKGTYKTLFELLSASYGAIALGLFRHGDGNMTDHVAIMPHGDSVVTSKDTVFVLLRGSAEMNCG